MLQDVHFKKFPRRVCARKPIEEFAKRVEILGALSYQHLERKFSISSLGLYENILLIHSE